MLKLESVLAALFVAVGAVACRDAAPARANVVVIVVDTLRADHADPAAGKADMPNVQALAADGVSFTRAFSQVPMTLPAHACLFSSRPPSEAGVKINGQLVPGELPVLAAWLSERGWQSLAAVSLATLWPLGPGSGIDRGFEPFLYDGERDCAPANEVNDVLGSLLDGLDPARPFFLFAHYSDPHEPYNAHGTLHRTARIALDGAAIETLATSEQGFRNGPVRLAPGEHRLEIESDHPFRIRIVQPRAPAGLLPMAWLEGSLGANVRRASLSITNPATEPVDCDLWLWLHDVVTNAEAAQRYRLEVEFADRAVGLFLGELKRRGLYDSSWIVFTSDHGEALGEHGHLGHVVNLYDEMLHVPLVVKPPKGHRARAELEAERDVLVRQVDLVPTLLDVLGVGPLPGQTGSSLRAGGARVLLAETHAPAAPRDLFCVRDLRTKLVYEPERDRFEMYDLAADPLELHDVFAERGAQVAAWQRTLRDAAARSAAAGRIEPLLDPENARRLQALGY